MVHAVKCIPEYFIALKTGNKNFEVRRNDRNYKVGDILAVNEYEPIGREFTGESLLFCITYVLNDDEFCKNGYVILALQSLVVMSAITE